MGSIFFACIPSSIYFMFMYHGQARMLCYVFPMALFIIMIILWWFHNFWMRSITHCKLLNEENTSSVPRDELNKPNLCLLKSKKQLYFFGDFILMGSLFLISQYCVYEHYFSASTRPLVNGIVSITYPIAFLFVFFTIVFTAGFQGKRYVGMII